MNRLDGFWLTTSFFDFRVHYFLAVLFTTEFNAAHDLTSIDFPRVYLLVLLLLEQGLSHLEVFDHVKDNNEYFDEQELKAFDQQLVSPSDIVNAKNACEKYYQLN